MARIAGVNIPQNKLVFIGLTYIYGIGNKFSNQICTSLEIPKAKRINELTDEDILKIREYIDASMYSLIFKISSSVSSLILFALGISKEVQIWLENLLPIP